jgi:hypothetical protein
VFCNQQENIFLIVSGIGNIKAAAASGYIYNVSRANANTSYLNVGIAGSQQFAVGEAWLIHKIIYHATNKAWYPQCVPTTLGLKSCVLQSVDEPHTNYQLQHIQDMEAYGVAVSASQLVTHEQIQILKIISDNALTSLNQVTPKWVTELVNSRWEEIQKVVHYLVTLSVDENSLQVEDDTLNAFLRKIHFSQYQYHQLKELIRRWKIHLPDKDPHTLFEKLTTSREVLFHLNKHLQDAKYYHS